MGLQSSAAYYDFRPAKVQITRSGAKVDLPHSGVITTPAWLNRWPTTTTNVNRARARMTYKFFLATDLLAVAERPIDPSSVTSTNPTRDDQYCTSCHKILDPVASTFVNRNEAAPILPDMSDVSSAGSLNQLNQLNQFEPIGTVSMNAHNSVTARQTSVHPPYTWPGPPLAS